MIILPALFFIAVFANAQEKDISSSKIWFHSINKHPNFSPSYNYFVLRDVEDFVWISSTSGLNRYDGIRFKQYFSNPDDSTALLSDNIQSPFFEDKKKDVWFSTSNSIQVYRRNTDDFRSYFEYVGSSEKRPNSYRAFFLERDTFLWFKADKEIYRYNIFQPESSAELVDTSNSYTLLVDTTLDGSVKYLYGTGKLSLNSGKYLEIENGKLKARREWFEHTKRDSLPLLINDIYTTGNFTWVGTNKGLFLWDRKKNLLKKLDKESDGVCYFTAYDNDKLLLWGKSRGFQFFDKSEGRFQKLEFRDFENEMISSEKVAQIYVDAKKHIWLSFINDGLVYANPQKVKFKATPIYSTGSLEAEYTYTCFFLDSKDNFWYGTQTQGVFYIEKKSGTVFQFVRPDDLSSDGMLNWITGIDQDEEGNIWISTRNDVIQFDQKTKKLKPVISARNNGKYDFLDLMKLRNGDLIACTNKKGVFKIMKGKYSFRLKRILNDTTLISSLYEDRLGNIYVCRDTKDIGVYEMKGDSLFFKYALPFEGAVTGYFEDRENGNLWISSFLGLAKVNISEGKIDTIFSKSKSFQNNSIHGMLGDEQGGLWLSTPKGLFNYQINTSKLQQFYLSDGTQSEKFHMHAAIKMSKGVLRFGGDKGLTDVEPAKIKFSEYEPVIRITDIKFNDQVTHDLVCEETGVKNVSLIKKLKRSYKDNTVSFEFVGIDYSDPSTVKLDYQLEGADETWVALQKGAPGFARYTNLKEGTYKLFIRSTNADGLGREIEPEEPVLELVILPPFYRETWFLTAMFLLLILAGYTIYRYRINQIKDRAELKNKALENKMAALRAQMNPHFIFNSLQTLSGLIVRKDTKASIEYVSQFAKLMRVILENSRLGFISLEKEIELLELYLNVESKRFKVPFTYDIKTSEALNTVKVLIPSMLLQPFVENSIKHGLFHKKEAGEIDIVFNEDNGLLKCVIEDNGIGRKKSTELNNQQGRQHQSRGLEIIKDRLKTLQKSDDQEYTIQIIDLYDRDKIAIGTRVEVLLPILMGEKN